MIIFKIYSQKILKNVNVKVRHVLMFLKHFVFVYSFSVLLLAALNSDWYFIKKVARVKKKSLRRLHSRCLTSVLLSCYFMNFEIDSRKISSKRRKNRNSLFSCDNVLKFSWNRRGRNQEESKPVLHTWYWNLDLKKVEKNVLEFMPIKVSENFSVDNECKMSCVD